MLEICLPSLEHNGTRWLVMSLYYNHDPVTQEKSTNLVVRSFMWKLDGLLGEEYTVNVYIPHPSGMGS